MTLFRAVRNAIISLYYRMTMADVTDIMAEMPQGRAKSRFASPSLATPARLRDLKVTNVGFLPAKDQWIHQRFHMHAIGVVTAGTGTYQVDHGPIHKVSPPCVFSVYPGPRFHYGPTDSGTWQERFICLDGSRIRKWKRAGWVFTDGLVYPLGDVTEVLTQHRLLLDTLHRGRVGDGDRSIAIAHRLLIEIYYARTAAHHATPAAPIVQAVMDYCRDHLAEQIDFEEIAARHAMSYSYLRQQMHRVTGHPPARYLTRLRCETAGRLLGESDLTIKQIGAKVGIDDPYTFSRTFKRCVGVSPLAYRRQTAPWR